MFGLRQYDSAPSNRNQNRQKTSKGEHKVCNTILVFITYVKVFIVKEEINGQLF